MSRDLVDQVKRAGLAPTRDDQKFEETLRRSLGLKTRYESARLAIGRSLSQQEPPPAPKPADGTSIPGGTLFGDDLDVWLAALVESDRPAVTVADAAAEPPDVTLETVRQLVHAHWQRGAADLRDDWREVGGDVAEFLLRLSNLLPNTAAGSGGRPRGDSVRDATSKDGAAAKHTSGGPAGQVAVRFGPVSEIHPGGQPIESVLNVAGSPHIALMGRSGTGKTTTACDIARQIASSGHGVPMLLIDPKGEFFEPDGSLRPPFDDPALGIRGVEVGTEGIPLDFLPGPDAGAVALNQAASRLRDAIASACRSIGDSQRMRLMNAIEEVVREEHRRDLAAITRRYEQHLNQDGQSADSVLAMLTEMTRVPTFEPEVPADAFFGQSWLISLRSLAADSHRDLAMLLLLDALARHVASSGESPVSGGVRQLRHLLVVDEAKRVLRDSRGEALEELLRQGRSRGQVVMLISQNPSDFQKQSEDFMSQLGTVVAFACGGNVRGLKVLKSAYAVDHLMANELSDEHLPPGVALVKPNNRPHDRVRCFHPATAAPIGG